METEAAEKNLRQSKRPTSPVRTTVGVIVTGAIAIAFFGEEDATEVFLFMLSAYAIITIVHAISSWKARKNLRQPMT